MARRPRVHVSGGLYLVELQGNAGEKLFCDEEDFVTFEELVADVLKATHCSMHAFCWFESTVYMGAQVGDVTLGRVVQRVTSRYARYANRKRRRSGHLFSSHYRAVLVQRSKYLLDMVRYINQAPQRQSVSKSMDEYRWSSHRAYAAREQVPWLTMHVAKGMLRNAGFEGVLGYLTWVHIDDRDFVALVAAEMVGSSHVIGNDKFRRVVLQGEHESGGRESLDAIIERVVQAQGVSRRDLFSSSRRQPHVLARALITWEATGGGAATLSEVAKRLGRDPSTLLSAVSRYRRERPSLFQDAQAAGLDDGDGS